LSAPGQCVGGVAALMISQRVLTSSAIADALHVYDIKQNLRNIALAWE
jgi:hypothetical protein